VSCTVTGCLTCVYDEDSQAEADCNIVMTSKGEFVEIQGTAETKPFNKETVDFLLELAGKGIKELFVAQKARDRRRAQKINHSIFPLLRTGQGIIIL